MSKTKPFVVAAIVVCAAGLLTTDSFAQSESDRKLRQTLNSAGLTGDIQQSLEKRLRRTIDPQLVEIGKLVFFDKLQGLHGDNSCAGCHAPAAGFGDFKSIAVGVDSNDIVGAARKGVRNQRRTPMVLNNAFYPKLMWNGRFFAPSGDPFDNSQGFAFTDPEGTNKFPANDPNVKLLLAAQGHIPGTELPEMAGFTGITGSFFATQRFFAGSTTSKFTPLAVGIPLPRYEVFSAGGLKLLGTTSSKEDPDFSQFDDGHGVAIPPAAADGSRNEPIRDVIMQRFNTSAEYKRLFGKAFPEVATGGPITFAMIGQALSEFQVSLTFADAPVDRFARGDWRAMSAAEKRGATLFFGKANCVSCHGVGGRSNQMFSDFEMYNIGVPQIAPKFGKGTGNVPFRNAAGDFVVSGRYDFGLADIRDKDKQPQEFESAKFKFRTSPLRNIHLQPTFFHNGSFTRLEDAVRHHLDPHTSAKSYDPQKAGVEPDLHQVADPGPILAVLDPKVSKRLVLTDAEIKDLVRFFRVGLADPKATPAKLAAMIPKSVPSGLPLQKFQPPRP